MSKSTLYHVFDTLTAEAATPTLDLSSLGTAFHLDVYFGAEVDFDDGDLVLQASPDGGTTWLDVPGADVITTATANSFKTHMALYGCTRIRFDLRDTNPGAGNSAELDIVVKASALRFETVDHLAFLVDGDSQILTLRDYFSPIGWAAYGDFGGGTLTLKCSPDGGATWYAVDSTAAAALKHTITAEEVLMKFSLVGSTEPDLVVVVY